MRARRRSAFNPANATLEFEVELISWKSENDLFGDGGVVRVAKIEDGEGGRRRRMEIGWRLASERVEGERYGEDGDSMEKGLVMTTWKKKNEKLRREGRYFLSA